MAGIHVGSVLVDVLPDARGWDEKLSAQIAPEAKAVGEKIGHQLEDDIADGTRLGVEKAKAELATIGDVKVEVKVDEDGSKAEIERVAQKMGTQFGTDFSNATTKSTSAMSPLIMAGLAGGLLAGGPLLIGAAGVVAAGMAAAFLYNQRDVAVAATAMQLEVVDAYTGVADVAVPYLVKSLATLRDAAIGLKPQMRAMFEASGPAIQGITDGIAGLVQGVMPGLVAAVKSGQPVFEGMARFLTSIGTGLGNMFQILSEHAPAFGQVFTSLGDVMGTLLPALGDLVSVGGEIGAVILPPLAAALGAVGAVLHDIAPLLPEITIGFGAWKAVDLLDGPLKTFGQNLAFASYSGGPLAGIAGKASGALSTMGSALPYVAVGLGLVTAAVTANTEQINEWSQALLTGGAAARTARDEMSSMKQAADQQTSGLTGLLHVLTGTSVVYDSMGKSVDKTHQSYKDLLAQMTPLAREQSLATRAQNDLNDALDRNNAVDAANALSSYHHHTAEATRQQILLDAALHGTSIAEEINGDRLHTLANKASAANTQIGLLKGALDALTGKAVTVDQAEIAVTQSVEAASHALDGQTGSVLDAKGALNLHSAAGAATSQTLITLGTNSHALIATMEQQGRTADEVKGREAELRKQFYDTALQMTGNKAVAEQLTNRYYGIPGQINTEITADTKAATDAAAAFKAKWDAIQSKTVYITARIAAGSATAADIQHTVAGIQHLGGAIGGIVHPFADGGFEPMQGGIAQIVAPQTYRVIGDRVTDDEAYIPINNSMRSLQILSDTANRMNFDLAPVGGGQSQATASGGSRVPALHVERYYESRGSSARETAEELAWMARTRG